MWLAYYVKWFVIFFALLICFVAVLRAEEQDPLLLQQTSLSSAVRSALQESRQSMENLETYYQSMMASLNKKLDEQSEESAQLSMLLTDTMNSFRDSSIVLENLNVQVELEKEKVRVRNTILIWAGILFLINVLAKIGAFICWGKGIKLPRWLDILI